jgi:hypothetical protein
MWRKQPKTPRAGLSSFAVACTGLCREQTYMLLNMIGELRVGTSRTGYHIKLS